MRSVCVTDCLAVHAMLLRLHQRSIDLRKRIEAIFDSRYKELINIISNRYLQLNSALDWIDYWPFNRSSSTSIIQFAHRKYVVPRLHVILRLKGQSHQFLVSL